MGKYDAIGKGLFEAAEPYFKKFGGKASRAAGDAAEKAPFKTIKLKESYRGENKPGGIIGPWGDRIEVRYLNDVERRDYRLTVDEDGLLRDSKGRPFNSVAGENPDAPGAIFVMDKHGNIYASNFEEYGKFHHSSLLGGEDVAGAGTLSVSDGRVNAISNSSGHYKPSAEINQQVVDHLRSQGVRIDDDMIDFTW
ncbi:hypothetical protein [Actinoallomurus sp. NPDC052274]|uniref:hypothetical protein n=1 Tax=Actinoallomurus sp. NPDC052274 TaxID=3155420 RepID=UPI00342A3803